LAEGGGGAILPDGAIEDPTAPPDAAEMVRAIWRQARLSDTKPLS